MVPAQLEGVEASRWGTRGAQGPEEPVLLAALSPRCPPALSPRSARGGSPDPRARWTALEDRSLMVPHPLPPPLPQCLRGPGGARCQSRADEARRPPPGSLGPGPDAVTEGPRPEQTERSPRRQQASARRGPEAASPADSRTEACAPDRAPSWRGPGLSRREKPQRRTPRAES